ncbi:MAG: alpha/beta hydrolase [Pseudomonadota bacterium]
MTHLVDQNTIINGYRIAHGVHGEGDPVLLMHGTPSSSYIWRNVLPTLVDAGYKVHVFDLLGFGLSERPWDPVVETSVSGQVPVLEALLDIWRLKDLHIIAHDIGGAVATLFSLNAPDRVRSLTLIDIVSFDSWPSKRTREQMKAGLERLINAPDADHCAHFREWLLSAVHNKEQMVETSMETFLGFISGPVGQASLFQHQIMHYDPKHTNEVAARYHELGKNPVQIIWGAEDEWQVVEWAHKLHGAIPGADLHVIEECGHFAMEDKSEEISEKLISFMRAHA